MKWFERDHPAWSIYRLACTRGTAHFSQMGWLAFRKKWENSSLKDVVKVERTK